jgi:hypothetical protein
VGCLKRIQNCSTHKSNEPKCVSLERKNGISIKSKALKDIAIMVFKGKLL